MQNKYKNWIKVGILTGALLVGGNKVLANSKSNLENIANQTAVVQTINANEPNSIEYNTIKEIVVKDFLNNYLKEITPKSNNFKKLKEKYGEKGLLKRYCSAHELTLKLAFKYQNKEIPKKEYVELGEQLSQKQYETSKGLSRVDYLNKKVSKAFAKWGKFKTQNFKKLLNASKKIQTPELKTKKQKQDYIKQLHNAAYSREEYTEYVKNQNKANDELYSSMKKTLAWYETIIGSGEIKTISEVTNKIYTNQLKKYFGEKNEKN